jgi:hypothetical protein
MHMMPWALVLALARAGKSIPARIAMMAITTKSSIKVNPDLEEIRRNDKRRVAVGRFIVKMGSPTRRVGGIL